MDDAPKREPWEKEYRNTESSAGRETGTGSGTLAYLLGGCGITILILIGIVFCLFAVCMVAIGIG